MKDKYSLLIADDDDAIRNGMSNYIDWDSMGFYVAASFEDGKEMIEYLEKNHVDVVLTDIQMSENSGLDVARYIFEHHLNTKVIILSGYKEFEYARQAIAYNVEDYVVDPETGEAMCRDCAIKAGIPVDDDLEENKEIEKHREDKLNKLNSDIMYDFNEAYKDWGKELAPNKTAFIDDYMDAFQDDFSYGDVNWKDYIVAIPELDSFYQEYSDVEDYEIPEDMKLKFYNLITEYVQNYIKGVCTDKITESVDNCVGEPLSSVLANLGDGIDIADADYDMMVWMPSYTTEDDVSDVFDKLVQLIESKILVKEEFNSSEDAVVIAGVADFIRDNKQIFIDEVDIPEDIKDEQDIEEYLVCTVFPALVSGYATDSLYTNIYNKLNGGK